MFPSTETPSTPRPAQRLAGALRLIRSFLLLEDDLDLALDAGHKQMQCHQHKRYEQLRMRNSCKRENWDQRNNRGDFLDTHPEPLRD